MFDSGEPSVQMMVLIALDSLQLLLELVAKRNPCQLAHNLFNLLQLSHEYYYMVLNLIMVDSRDNCNKYKGRIAELILQKIISF